MSALVLSTAPKGASSRSSEFCSKFVSIGRSLRLKAGTFHLCFLLSHRSRCPLCFSNVYARSPYSVISLFSVDQLFSSQESYAFNLKSVFPFRKGRGSRLGLRHRWTGLSGPCLYEPPRGHRGRTLREKLADTSCH